MNSPLITVDDSRDFAMHGVAFHSYVSSASGARELAGWTAEFEPQTPGLAHTMTREEILHVLEGQLEVDVDDTRVSATQGDVVLVPAGARFRVSNTTEEVAHAWIVTSIGMRAAMESGEAITPPWAQ